MIQRTLQFRPLTLRSSNSMSLLTRITAVAAFAAIFAPAIARAQDPAPAKDTVAPKADSAAAATTTDTVDKTTLTGFYELAPGRELAITLEKGELYGAPPNAEKKKLIYQSGLAYAVDGTKMTLTFILGADGRASDIIMAQNGQTRMIKRTR